MNYKIAAFSISDSSYLKTAVINGKISFYSRAGLIPPDVYFLPMYVDSTYSIIPMGKKVEDGEYNYIFIELNATEEQLSYTLELTRFEKTKVLIILGPPELISARLNHNKLLLLKKIFSSSHFHLAYSKQIKEFYDGLAGKEIGTVIPWCFDKRTIDKVTKDRVKKRNGFIDILLETPMRFSEMTQNYPYLLKWLITDTLKMLPSGQEERFRFHTFVYMQRDKELFYESGYNKDFNIGIKRKMGFSSFVRFVNSCDAVINMTRANILGRTTFISAALEKPGIFSSNSELNRELFPYSTLDLLDVKNLRLLLEELLEALINGKVNNKFYPDMEMLNKKGNYEANRREFHTLLSKK